MRLTAEGRNAQKGRIRETTRRAIQRGQRRAGVGYRQDGRHREFGPLFRKSCGDESLMAPIAHAGIGPGNLHESSGGLVDEHSCVHNVTLTPFE